MADMPQREQTSLEEEVETASGTSEAGEDSVASPESEKDRPTQSEGNGNAASADHLWASDAYTAKHNNEPQEDTPSLPQDDEQIEEQDDDYETADSEEEEVTDLDEELGEDGKPRISFAGKRVLLIEDEVETANILKDHLTEMGISEVIVTQNANAALNQLTDKEKFPHVVVLELALIGMDGI